MKTWSEAGSGFYLSNIHWAAQVLDSLVRLDGDSSCFFKMSPNTNVKAEEEEKRKLIRSHFKEEQNLTVVPH